MYFDLINKDAYLGNASRSIKCCRVCTIRLFIGRYFRFTASPIKKRATPPSEHYDTFTEHADTPFMNDSSLDLYRVYFRSRNDRIFRKSYFHYFLALSEYECSRYDRRPCRDTANINKIKPTGEKPLLQIQYRTHTDHDDKVDKLMITIS